MITLLHSSKTMRTISPANEPLSTPVLLDRAAKLNTALAQLSVNEIKKLMKVSEKIALETKQKIEAWNIEQQQQTPAMDSFVGDIYSGLRSLSLTPNQRRYAQDHLRILSGLYGILRPLDGIMPYRLEMGYKSPHSESNNLYEFWGDSIARTLAKNTPILNLTSNEYAKAALPHLHTNRVITPRFLTVNKKTNIPTFVVVHAKIARGAMARWTIITQVSTESELQKFNDLGYSYSNRLSVELQPVFVCQEFKGIGLSQRLQ